MLQSVTAPSGAARWCKRSFDFFSGARYARETKQNFSFLETRMTVAEVMHRGQANAVVPESACVREAIEELHRKALGAVCVIEGDRLAGLLTDGDIRRLLFSTQRSLPDLFLLEVSKVMTPAPKTLRPDASIEEGIAFLERYAIWVVPVVDEQGRLVGMAHLHPLLKAASAAH